MLNEEQHKKLDLFYQALSRVHDPQGAPADLGLIVPPPDYTLEELYPPGEVEEIVIHDESDIEAVLGRMASALEEGRWVLLVLTTSKIDPKLYETLRHLGTTGSFELALPEGEYVTRQSPDARVVLVVTDPVLEAMTINTFLSIFGPILRL